jgi:hypothetical protein
MMLQRHCSQYLMTRMKSKVTKPTIQIYRNQCLIIETKPNGSLDQRAKVRLTEAASLARLEVTGNLQILGNNSGQGILKQLSSLCEELKSVGLRTSTLGSEYFIL